MKLRDAYRQKMEAQIEELNARLALARAQAKRAAADGKIIAHEELAETEQRLAALKAKVAELGTASESAWQDLSKGIDKAWSDLSRAAGRAMDRFR